MRRAARFGFGRGDLSRAVDEEIAFHLQMKVDKLVASGMSVDAARREALRLFGDLEGVRSMCVTLDQQREHAMRRKNYMDELRQDIGYALRMLRRNLGVTSVIILTLAIGIGANTAIFALVNAVLLRELPVPAPDELVTIGDPASVGSIGWGDMPRTAVHSWKTYMELREQRELVSGLAASGRPPRLDVQLGGATAAPEQPRGRMVSGNYFRVLGVPAFRGRVFDGSEDRSVGGAPVVTISYGYWMSRLAGDEQAIGRDLHINGSRFTIIGVTPPWYEGEVVGAPTDMWIPITMQPVIDRNRESLLDTPQAYWLHLLGRRAPGVSLEQAQLRLAAVIRDILKQQQTIAATAAAVDEMPIPVSSGAKGLSRVRANYKAPLLALLAGVGLLLLIICANVASLLLARAVARTREMSVRLALGSSRSRLVRQLLTEGTVLALCGAAAGLLLARWGSQLLLALAADGGTPISIDAALDLPVVAFTIALAVVAVLVFGLAPALRASHSDLQSVMRANAKSVAGNSLTAAGKGTRIPIGKLLISAQIALSLVLLVGAGLLVRSLRGVESAPTGLDRDHLLIVDVDAWGRGHTGERLYQFAREMADILQRVPGVIAVSYSENGIFSGTESMSNVGVPNFSAKEQSDSIAHADIVGPGYVRATGARLLQGRDLTATDVAGTLPVVLVNESFARFYFGRAEQAAGTTIRIGDSTTAQIVGVIADIKDHALTGEVERRYYTAFLQPLMGEAGQTRFIVRTTGDPASLTAAVRRAILASDAQLPIIGIDPLKELMRSSIRSERLLARLATGFGVLALLLAAIGLYGVMTYAITRRTSEIGLRVALGARRGAVVGMVLGDALRLVVVGVVVGIPLALGAMQLIRTQLHNVEAADPTALILAVVVLGASGMAAALLPSLRASRVAPLVALRED
jgi:predicted permease